MPLDPSDLDTHLLAQILQAVAPSSSRPRCLYEVSGAFAGVWTRFAACAAHEDAIAQLLLNEQLILGTRRAQERELFEFLVTGGSAIECATFAVYRYASCLAQGYHFKVNLENSKVATTARAFKKVYPQAEITRVIVDVDDSREWMLWKRARNILLRRSHPWREGSERGPAQWLGEEFGYEFSVERRKWLGRAIHQLLTASFAFIQAHPVGAPQHSDSP